MNYSELVRLQREFYTEHITREIPFRLCALDRLEEGIKTHEQEITEALKKDLGKSPFESYLSEIGLILNEIRYTKRNLKEWAKDKHIYTPLFLIGSRSTIHYEPRGIALIIAPWNYPFQLCLSPLIGSICAGNCSVLKPSPDSPHVSYILSVLISECFEPEYIALINGSNEETGKVLQEKFDYIFYTGGMEYGRQVLTAASRHLTPVTLELGGKSPCIVDKDADIPKAARRIVWGKLLNCGQTCVAPDYLLVHESVKDKVTEFLKKEIIRQYSEDPRLNPDYPRIINERHFNRLVSMLNNGNILFGGTYDKKDLYISPTLIEMGKLEEKPDSPLLSEEIFGPVLPILSFSDIDDCVEYINERDKPLALYYFTSGKNNARYMIQHTTSGGVCINDTVSHVANNRLPFGGIGNSGMGAYHGRYSFETFSHARSIVTTTNLYNIGMKFAPYNKKIKWLKKLM